MDTLKGSFALVAQFLPWRVSSMLKHTTIYLYTVSHRVSPLISIIMHLWRRRKRRSRRRRDEVITFVDKHKTAMHIVSFPGGYFDKIIGPSISLRLGWFSPQWREMVCILWSIKESWRMNFLGSIAKRRTGAQEGAYVIFENKLAAHFPMHHFPYNQ